MKHGLSLSLVFLLLMGACGPMNTKPADNKNSGLGAGAAADTASLPPVALSDNKKFVIDIEPLAGSAFKPEIGDNLNGALNRYSIHFTHKGGTPPTNAKLKVEYFKQHSTVQRKYSAEAKVQADGSMNIVLTFKKRGNWELHFYLESGDLKDEYTYYLDL